MAVARARHGDAEIGADAAGILAQHHHPVGQQDRFFDVVGDDEDGAGGHFLAVPELEQLRAQVLGGEHVERGKRLVHEEHFRLHDQCAGEADALLHAAGKLLGVRRARSRPGPPNRGCAGLRFMRSVAAMPRALSGASTLSSTVSHGNNAKLWKTMETFGHGPGHRLAVPQHLARGGRSEAGEHAQHGGFARARWPEQRQNLAGINGQVGGCQHLDACLGRPVELLDCAGLDDRLCRWCHSLLACRWIGTKSPSSFIPLFGGGAGYRTVMRIGSAVRSGAPARLGCATWRVGTPRLALYHKAS